MARIRHPVTFSKEFGVERELLEKFGANDPTLTFDTNLFVDPLLLAASSQSEISGSAVARFRQHFTDIAKLLVGATPGDRLWRAAAVLFDFRENDGAKGTGLGYGGESVSGRGFGPQLTARLMRTAKAIIDLGITDPDLFLLLGLLEENVGPDSIGDMTTRVIFHDIAAYNARVFDAIGGSLRRDYEYELPSGHEMFFPLNRYSARRLPVVLVPRDILRKLPIVLSRRDISSAAAKSQGLRRRVNREVGGIWAAYARKDKARLRAEALAAPENIRELLKIVRDVPRTPYDMDADPEGEVFWHSLLKRLTADYPFNIPVPEERDDKSLRMVVRSVIDQFRHLIEERDLARELWAGDKPRKEKSAQRLFFVVADCYCRASNVDITPEAETGAGPVDFKFSRGYRGRLLVEIKLSTNPDVPKGYHGQLAAYAAGEQASAFYLVINVGGRFTDFQRRLEAMREEAVRTGRYAPELVYVDGFIKPSASKRR